MPLHHILCVHGIGKHSNNWAVDDRDDGDKSFATLLKELWEKYPTKETGAFADHVKIHSIHYDDEIEKIFKTWTDYAADLKAGLALSPLLQDQAAWFTDAIDAASEADNDDNFGYTHLMDLILFAGSPTLQDRLVTLVGRQIIDLIKAKGKGDKVSIIGHSMGCAMAHKAIQALYNETVKGTGGQTLKGDFKFENITWVANTSYMLSRDRDAHYDGNVRPSLTAGDGCCYTWINVNHKLDPVGRFQPFDYRANPRWLDPKIDGRGWHKDIVTNRLSSKSVHSINHYFRDPALHIPFFELVFDAEFTDKERGDAVDKFIAATPEGRFKGLKAQLDLLDVSNKQSFKDFVVALKAFREAIRLFA